MSTTPIPAGPVFLCLIGMGLIGGSLWYASQPESDIEIQAPFVPASVDVETNLELHRYHDNVLAIEATDVILRQSGFAPDRSTFSRSIQRIQSVATQPELDPQFVGTMGRGSGLKVMIIWRPGEQPKVHSIGDETPWGKLVEVSSSEVVFDLEGDRKTLAMY